MRNRRGVAYGMMVGLLAVVCLGGGSGIARANVITLDLTGQLMPSNEPGETGGTCVKCTLGGTVTIDNTLGKLLSADVTMSGESPSEGPFTDASRLGSFGGEVSMLISSASQTSDTQLILTAYSLIGYDGGSLEDVFVFGTEVSRTSTPVWRLVPDTGFLSPAPATGVPEPSTLLLLASGVAATLGFRCLRQRGASNG
jgi:hypothetical protein